MLSIEKLTIKDIGRIRTLELTFNRGLNLICGPNGVGKTTILECIGQAFSHIYTPVLRKRAGSDSGTFECSASIGDKTETFGNAVSCFDPQYQEWTPGAGSAERYLITLKTNRSFNYLPIKALEKDPNNADRHRQLGSRGIEFQDIKNWFVNRYLFSAHQGALNEEQQANLALAKRSFSELDPSVQFSKVVPDSFDLMIKTSNGEIFFEYLSSGFKSCLCLVFGIIKEIEYRFKDPHIRAESFDGVILIDELDLHLHPDWQPKLVHLLKRLFPKAQFIGATHSPHMIQAAEPREIIALEESEKGEVIRRELEGGEFGFQGWTIEEILTDVMGMSDTRSQKYREIENAFEAAIEANDRGEAERVFAVLGSFLHPNNAQKKLFRLQFGRLGEDK